MQISSAYDITSTGGKDSLCHLQQVGHLSWQKNINSLLQGSENNKITIVVIRSKFLNILMSDVIKCN
jgi:hypothetical protein